MACSPSCTTSMRTSRMDLRRARPTRRTSLGSSSTWRIVLELSLMRGGGQFDPEAAAPAWFGFDPDFAGHAFGPFAHEGEADAGAGVGIVAVQTLEQFENFILMLRGDADAVVLDAKLDAAGLLLRPDAHIGFFGRVDEFEGIGDEVGNDLAQGGAVSEDGVEWLDDADVGLAFVGFLAE